MGPSIGARGQEYLDYRKPRTGGSLRRAAIVSVHPAAPRNALELKKGRARLSLALPIDQNEGFRLGRSFYWQEALVNTMLSTRHPGRLANRSVPIRHRSLMVCPFTFGPRFAVVVM